MMPIFQTAVHQAYLRRYDCKAIRIARSCVTSPLLGFGNSGLILVEMGALPPQSTNRPVFKPLKAS